MSQLSLEHKIAGILPKVLFAIMSGALIVMVIMLILEVNENVAEGRQRLQSVESDYGITLVPVDGEKPMPFIEQSWIEAEVIAGEETKDCRITWHEEDNITVDCLSDDGRYIPLVPAKKD